MKTPRTGSWIALLVLLLAASAPALALVPLDGIKEVHGGNLHSCALTTIGSVKCWGANSSGQIGDGTNTTRPLPTTVTGLGTGVVQLAVGFNHACALMNTGVVKCWGSGPALGRNSSVNSNVPVDAVLPPNVQQISMGDSHGCALLPFVPFQSTGGVWCWGTGTSGQIGNGSNSNQLVPVQVTALTGFTVTAIAAGGTHTCVLIDSGAVKCWGNNGNGRLGDGTTTQRNTPVDVVGIINATKIGAGGEVTCALVGTLKCWGTNTSGRIGDGTTTNPRLTPTDVVGPILGETIAGIALGNVHSCAWTQDGKLYCWGSSANGQVGLGSFAAQPTPTVVIPSGVTHANGRGFHACAALSSGQAQCWGQNASLQLGLGPMNAFSTAPVDTLALPTAAVDISAGNTHACARLVDGAASCWGTSSQNQLGRTTPGQFDPDPGPVGSLPAVVQVAAGAQSTCARTAAGGVLCWGATAIGNGTTSAPLPVPVTGLDSGATGVEVGQQHACAVAASGGVKCWGVNSSGQLGDGTTTLRTTPVDVTGVFDALAVSAGNVHTCAIVRATLGATSGSAMCWGGNGSGQLGNGATATSVPTPVAVLGRSDYVAIAAGDGSTCALTAGGAVQCWGSPVAGRLGNGQASGSPVTTPLDVTGLTSGVTAISNNTHTCALMADGTVKCWGQNITGEIGDGTTNSALVPTAVAGLTQANAVSAGANFSCAQTGSGVKCWGSLAQGQLGDGRYPGSRVPLTVQSAGDVTPDSFTFPSQANVMPDSIVTSAPAVITGIAVPADVFVINGSYSVGCVDPYTSNPGLVSSGQSICVRHTAADSPGIDRTTTIYVGNGSATFTSTTGAFTPFVYRMGDDDAGAAIGTSAAHTFAQGGTNPLDVNAGDPRYAAGVSGLGVRYTLADYSRGASVMKQANENFVMEVWARAEAGGGGTIAINGHGADAGYGLFRDGTSYYGLLSGITVLGDPGAAPVSLDRWQHLAIVRADGETRLYLDGVAIATTPTGPRPPSFNASPSLAVGGGSNFDDRFVGTLDELRIYTVQPQAFTPLALNVRRLAAAAVGAAVTTSPSGNAFPTGTVVRVTVTPDPGKVVTSYNAACALVSQSATQLVCDATLANHFDLQLVVGDAPPVIANAHPDFNDDGKADLLFRNTNGSSAIWLLDGLATTQSTQIFPAGTNWYVAHMADLNGDGKTDLVWQNPDGRVTLYLMDGTTAVTKQLLLPAGGGWTVTHTGDLDGDGKADLVFQNVDGTIAAYLMDGVTVKAGATILGAGSGWAVTKIGDFNGDGKADFVWTHADGRVAIWLMNGLTPLATNQILNGGTGWSVTHTADFNGDGKSDLVWQNVDGQIAIWLMNGAAMASGSGLLGAGTGWSVTRVGDFNGDGKDDLFFLHADGRAAIYLMNGLAPTQTTQILNAGGGWSAKRLQDVNGDGKADIIWENVDGTVAIWIMNGTTMTSGAGVLPAATGWSVSGASRKGE